MGKNWKRRRIDPTVDCVFKRLLGSEQHKALTLDFLNAMVGLVSTTKFSDLAILDPHLLEQHQDGKRPIVDLLVRLETGVVAQVEVQNKIVFTFPKRCIYDWSQLLSAGLRKGEPYEELKGAISIWILTENLFSRVQTEAPILKFRVACLEAGLELEPDSCILVVQLKNWKGPGTLNPAAERWLLLLRDGKHMDLSHPPESLDDEVMRMALDVMMSFASDQLEFLRYTREQKSLRVNEWTDEHQRRTIASLTQAKEAALAAKEQEREAKEAALAAKEAAEAEVMRLRAELADRLTKG